MIIKKVKKLVFVTKTQDFAVRLQHDTRNSMQILLWKLILEINLLENGREYFTDRGRGKTDL